MAGRDPGEAGRVASPLELLLDLTFVVAVGSASSQFAELLAEGHLTASIVAFVLAMSAISVAWIGFSWFASAFDTDDWLYRVLSMVQMAGVVVFSLGLPAMFRSVDEGHRLDVRVMVCGYVVMRIALVAQWWRAARGSDTFRPVAMANVRWTSVLQIAWLAFAFVGLRLPMSIAFTIFGVLAVAELLLPVVTGSVGRETPWHPHHIAERYSLFTIIVLGEGVVGTVASTSGLLGDGTGVHWSGDAMAVVVAGVGLTFGMWWVYFTAPFGDALHRRRGRGYVFGFGHIPLFIAVAAVGAGLHVAGLQLEHHAAIGTVAVTLALAVPVGAYLLTVYTLHTALLAAMDAFHVALLAISMVLLGAAVLLAVAGVDVTICLLVVTAVPFVTVIGYETVGHRHQQEMLR